MIGKEEECPALEAPETSLELPKTPKKSSPNRYLLIQKALLAYQHLTGILKRLPKTPHCRHSNSCLYYSLSGGAKLFGIGFLVQLSLKMLFQIKKVVRSPAKIKGLIFARDTLKIGAFLGGFSVIYKVNSLNLKISQRLISILIVS